MSELKSCPFCGGDNKHSDDCYIPMLVEYVERKLFLDPDYEKKLEEAWNRRTERTCEGCAIPNRDYGHAPSPCNFCARNNEERYDLYTPAKVVE